MKTRKSIALLGITCLVLALGALPFISACSPSPSEVIELKYNHYFPQESLGTVVALDPWARMIEEATNNKVKMISYPSATLSKPQDAYDATLSGLADISLVFAGMNPGVS